MSASKTISEKRLDLDDVLDKFGIFNRYHLAIMLMAFFGCITNSMYSTNYIFSAEDVKYRCMDNLEKDYCSANSSASCSEWVYDNPDSFVAYFQLACQDWKRTLVGTTHSFGYMCGLLIVGPLSDRIGRKTTAIITGVLGGVFGLIRSFSTWYWFYISMEFLEAALGDNCSPMYVLTLEIVSSSKRLVFYMMCSFGYALGGILLAILAYATPDWRWLLRMLYAPAFIYLSYKYFLDESPRWLLSKGRNDEAIKILENAARKNKIEIDRSTLEKLFCEVSPNVSFGELLKTTFQSKKLRRRFFVCIVWWITCTFVSYGLSINSVSLQGNKYVNFALTSIVDIPGNFMITYILIHFKRKIPLQLCFFAGAAFCLAQPFMPIHLPWLSITLYMAGKLMCSFYFSITYLYTLELFPTYTRNSMHALCSSIGRIGSIIAPQTPLLMVYWSGLPSLIFGLVALFAGLVTFLVPDVANDALPDTVHQAEALGKLPHSKGMDNEGMDMSEM